MGVRILLGCKGKVVSPLAADLSKRRLNSTSSETTKTFTQTPENRQTSATRVETSFLYVGESFTVRIPYSTNLNNLVHNALTSGFVTTDFVSRGDSMQPISLTAGGYKLLSVPNAGGSSVISEVLSFEVLGRCFGAKLQKTEMEVTYFPSGGSITDYVCELCDVTVGVSVTRAWKYLGDFEVEDANRLLNKKLKGVIQSSQNSTVKWNKQILHVWSASHLVTSILAQAYSDLDPEVKANTVVLVTTVSRSKADYIFKNG